MWEKPEDNKQEKQGGQNDKAKKKRQTSQTLVRVPEHQLLTEDDLTTSEI